MYDDKPKFRKPERDGCYCRICRVKLAKDKDYAIMFNQWWLKQQLVICQHCLTDMVEIMRKTKC